MLISKPLLSLGWQFIVNGLNALTLHKRQDSSERLKKCNKSHNQCAASTYTFSSIFCLFAYFIKIRQNIFRFTAHALLARFAFCLFILPTPRASLKESERGKNAQQIDKTICIIYRQLCTPLERPNNLTI